MSDRKLASIQEVVNIQPIPKYDRVEHVQILGWWMIAKKGEFAIGDKVVFVEPDSILPPKPEFEFLASRKYRIKTIKMCGVVSQGIVFPLSILPKKNWNVGDDVTDLIGIQKYEPDVYNQPVQKKGSPNFPQFLMRMKWFRKLFFETRKDQRGFPRFLSKTDETRIQNLPHVFNDKETQYIVTEKIDGQSGTFFLEKKKTWFGKQTFDFGVCSRNLRLWKKDITKPWWYVADRLGMEYILKILFKELEAKHFVAIQGEVISPQAQGNKYNVKEPHLYVFNLIVDGEKIEQRQAMEITQATGIDWCPIEYVNFSFENIDTVEELMNYVDGNSQLISVLREGFVFRNYERDISFKCVSNEWLLKYD